MKLLPSISQLLSKELCVTAVVASYNLPMLRCRLEKDRRNQNNMCCIFVIFHFLISLENTNTWSVNNLLWLVPTCVKCSCWTNCTGNFSPFVRQRNRGSKWAGKQDPTVQFIPRLSTQRRNQKYLLIISFFVSFFILSFFSFFWICRLYAFLL